MNEMKRRGRGLACQICNFQSAICNLKKKTLLPGGRRSGENGILRGADPMGILVGHETGVRFLGGQNPRPTGVGPWVAEPGRSFRRTSASGAGPSVPEARRFF